MKTKVRYIEFIGGKGFVNFIADEAYIEGVQLSGLDMDNVKFKITISKTGTLKIEEVDTKLTTSKQRKRLLEIIEDKSIGSYRNRSVIHELNFESVTKIKDKSVPLYLAVEIDKPIDLLSDILNDNLEISESQLHTLDDLLNVLFDDSDLIEDTLEESFDEIQVETDLLDIKESIQNSFDEMKKEKVKELKSNLDKKQQELSSLEFQSETIKMNLDSVKQDIKLIEDRISSLQPIDSPLGYYFFISERQNEVVTLDENTEKIIRDKVSKVKSINLENFMKLFTDGEFHIKLALKKDDDFEIIEDYFTISDESKKKLSKYDISIDKDKLIYNGELTWGQLTNEFIKIGFEENEEFNKLFAKSDDDRPNLSKNELKTTKNTF